MTKSHADHGTATGGCLCGAVRFCVREVPTTFGLCHCPMCRRWTGGPFAEVSVPSEAIDWTGEAFIGLYRASDWAERAFCQRCGSTLYFRHTRQDKWFGSTDIALGAFDDPAAFDLSYEIYTDQAVLPVSDRGQRRLSRAEVIALNPELETQP